MSTLGATLIVVGVGVALFSAIMLVWRHIQRSVWKPPGAVEAGTFVWVSVYGQPANRRPEIFWVPSDGTAGTYGWTDRFGRKVAGHAVFTANVVNVGFPREGGKFSESALVYELARVVRYQHGARQYDDAGATASDKAEFTGMVMRGQRELAEWEKGRS